LKETAMGNGKKTQKKKNPFVAGVKKEVKNEARTQTNWVNGQDAGSERRGPGDACFLKHREDQKKTSGKSTGYEGRGRHD